MKYDRILQTTKRSGTNNSKEYVIVHHTGSPNYEAMCRVLSGGRDRRWVSCHYVVAQDGRVAKIGKHNDVLWHAGRSRYGGRVGFNRYSIGIEICSNGHDYTSKQKEVVRELIEEIIKKEDIPVERILRHADVSGYRGKWDVGLAFIHSQHDTWEDYQQSFSNNYDQDYETIKRVIRLNSANWKKLDKLDLESPHIEEAKHYLSLSNQELRKI